MLVKGVERDTRQNGTLHNNLFENNNNNNNLAELALSIIKRSFSVAPFFSFSGCRAENRTRGCLAATRRANSELRCKNGRLLTRCFIKDY